MKSELLDYTKWMKTISSKPSVPRTESSVLRVCRRTWSRFAGAVLSSEARLYAFIGSVRRLDNPIVSLLGTLPFKERVEMSACQLDKILTKFDRLRLRNVCTRSNPLQTSKRPNKHTDRVAWNEHFEV